MSNVISHFFEGVTNNGIQLLFLVACTRLVPKAVEIKFFVIVVHFTGNMPERHFV